MKQNTITSPLVQKPRPPRFDEIKISPVNDILAKLLAEKASLGEKVDCNINCPCGPCRAGDCPNCTFQR